MLWLQGWGEAPEIVAACRRTWERHNPGWTVVPLTRESAYRLLDGSELLSAVETRTLPPEALSDVIRIGLLQKYGGVWADATTYCLQPLNDWLPAHLASGFFAFSNPGPDRMLSTWFLAAAIGSQITTEWAAATADYWRARSERHHYFWFHILFAECYARNKDCRQVWDQTQKISSEGPRYFFPQEEELLRLVASADRELVEGGAVPLVKLRHAVPADHAPENSVLRYLCARAGDRS